MALEGTHIRFAIDVKKDFGVAREDKYIAGAVYPDSRYPTGIDRDLTHGDNQMAQAFWQDDDFRKGWASHLLYDKIQQSVHGDWFAHILQAENPDMTGEEDWIIRSALKILQDIDDIQAFAIRSYLDSLQYVETPNGEDAAVVAEYNRRLVSMYDRDTPASITDLEHMWSGWGVPEQTAAKMREKAIEIQADADLMQMNNKVYDETMRRKDEFWRRYCV